MKNRIWLFIVISFFLCACATPSDSVVQHAEIKIGTASPDGVYYQIGHALAGMLNKSQPTYTVAAYPTEGSAANIEALLNGDLSFAFVQSDRQYQAYHGLAAWKKKGSQQHLRSIAALYPEMITLVVRNSSAIRTIEDIKGKPINLGALGSGEHQNATDILSVLHFHPQNDLMGELFPARENAPLMKEGVLDGYFLTSAHPSDTVKNSIRRKESIRMISLPDAMIAELTKQYPYYHKAVIPPQKYYPFSTSTIGVTAILTTNSYMADDLAYAMTKTIVENFDRLKAVHTAFQDRTQRDLVTNLPAPLHPGAKRYYVEKGILAP